MLRLEVLHFAGPIRWRWRLTDTHGAFLADQPVEPDEHEWRYDACIDLAFGPDEAIDHASLMATNAAMAYRNNRDRTADTFAVGSKAVHLTV